MKEVGAYIQIANKSCIVWMDGTEIGMAPKRVRAKYLVLLWPYAVESFAELVRTFTHEIAHYAHPDLDFNDPAVEAITTSLMETPEWLAVAYQIVGQEQYAALVHLYQEHSVSIDCCLRDRERPRRRARRGPSA